MDINFKELKELYIDFDEYLRKVEKINDIIVTYEDQRIPLFVELGELLNEFPTKFKYWRQSAKDNRDNGLEEFADCLNIIFGMMSFSDLKSIKMNLDIMTEIFIKDNNDIYYNIYSIIDISYKRNPISQFYNLIAIGYKLGFTWEEIYKASKNKIKIINERLDNGY